MTSIATESRPRAERPPVENRVVGLGGFTASTTSATWPQTPDTHQETGDTSTWIASDAGSWLSKDPIGISGGLNQYVAFNNNPVNFVDKDGESAIAAADYWADMAGGGYNQGGFGGWWKVQTGNTMGMFINMWHAQEMEEHAGLAGEYWDECKGKSAKHMAAVGGYAVLDYVQFTGLQKLGGLTGEGRQGTRIFQLRNKATGRPVFRLDKGPVPGKVGPKVHYHRPPDLKLHRPYQGGL